ncbi:HD domain-containing protein [Bacillus thuringiensis]
MEKRIEQIIEFLRIIGEFKLIEGKTKISNNNCHENDAEHTWHMCMFALLLHKEIEEELNLERVLKLILVHDLGEIYAGDTYAHDSSARINKKKREEEAVKKLLRVKKCFIQKKRIESFKSTPSYMFTDISAVFRIYRPFFQYISDFYDISAIRHKIKTLRRCSTF